MSLHTRPEGVLNPDAFCSPAISMNLARDSPSIEIGALRTMHDASTRLRQNFSSR